MATEKASWGLGPYAFDAIDNPYMVIGAFEKPQRGRDGVAQDMEWYTQDAIQNHFHSRLTRCESLA
jgi:hypothetical protein